MGEPIPYEGAAKVETVTLTGWVCQGCGRLYTFGQMAEVLLTSDRSVIEAQNVRAAFYCCSKRSPCAWKDCPKISEVHRTLCSEHMVAHDHELWEKRKRGPWRPGLMLYSDAFERYFPDPDEAREWLDDREVSFEDARFVVAEPNRVREFDLGEWFCDEMPEEDGDPAALHGAEVTAAVEALNKALHNMPPISWYPGKLAWDGATQLDAPPSSASS